MTFDYHLWQTWGLGLVVTIYKACDEKCRHEWEAAQAKFIIGPLLVDVTFPVSRKWTTATPT